jgi:hypothetical protein
VFLESLTATTELKMNKIRDIIDWKYEQNIHKSSGIKDGKQKTQRWSVINKYISGILVREAPDVRNGYVAFLCETCCSQCPGLMNK